jgi:hypothetical protein
MRFLIDLITVDRSKADRAFLRHSNMQDDADRHICCWGTEDRRPNESVGPFYLDQWVKTLQVICHQGILSSEITSMVMIMSNSAARTRLT